MARIRHQRDRDFVARRPPLSVKPEMVLHVARLALAHSLAACLPSNSPKIVAYGLPSTCVSTLMRPRCAMAIATSRPPSYQRGDDLVEHRDEHVAAFDGEALVSLIRAAEETLEPVDFSQPPKNRFLLVTA